jgi:hypothetical protein
MQEIWDLGIGVEKKGLESQRQRKGKRNKDKNRMGKRGKQRIAIRSILFQSGTVVRKRICPK